MENYNNRFNVLLVEDNPADVELTKEAFKQCQSSAVIQAMSSGIEALNYLRNVQENLPDAILLDLNLPSWDGKSFLRELKTDGNLRKIPVIVLTTSDTSKDVRESYSLYANSYIVKPLDVDIYFEKIKHLDAFWFRTALLPTKVQM